MFNKKSNSMSKSVDADNARNHLSKGTSIVGDIKTNGDIRIDGNVEGSINSSGKVVIGPNGVIDGEIHCVNANVAGEVKGKVVVKDLLELLSSSSISGEIIYGKLSVEPSAKITGTLSLGAVIKDISNADSSNSEQKHQKQA